MIAADDQQHGVLAPMGIAHFGRGALGAGEAAREQHVSDAHITRSAYNYDRGFMYSLPRGSKHMFPGARSSPADHVKRPRTNPGAENVQARIVIPVDHETAERTRMRPHGQ